MRKSEPINVSSKTIIVAVALLCLAIVGFESLRPHANAAVAIVFPPWVDADAALDRATEAGAAEPHAGRYPFVTFVEDSSPGFRQRVRRQGALLVLDAGKLGRYLSGEARS